MFSPQLNYFSVLIPTFLMLISCILLVWGHYKQLIPYMRWLNLAIICIVAVQVIQTLISPENVYAYILLNSFLFFSGIACISHAVYLRLGIQTRWSVVIGTIVIAEILLGYYAYYLHHLDARIAIIAIACSCIGLNHFSALRQSNSAPILDRLLILNLYGVLAVITIRAALLIILDHSAWVLQRDFLWAATQFLILFFTISMLTTFISCSVNDTLKRLYRERNLDPLTGLLNRRALNERLAGFTGKMTLYQHAILLCDIDYFKRVNDEHGHQIGDLALQHVANIISEHLRKYDEVARIGGEEFQVLLLDVPHQTALGIAERIRCAVQDSPLRLNGRTLYLTMSIGVSYFHSIEDYNPALEDADMLLYQAKKFGRNNIQWEFLSEPMPERLSVLQEVYTNTSSI